jgi:hypothetical protein
MSGVHDRLNAAPPARGAMRIFGKMKGIGA